MRTTGQRSEMQRNLLSVFFGARLALMRSLMSVFILLSAGYIGYDVHDHSCPYLRYDGTHRPWPRHGALGWSMCWSYGHARSASRTRRRPCA